MQSLPTNMFTVKEFKMTALQAKEICTEFLTQVKLQVIRHFGKHAHLLSAKNNTSLRSVDKI